MQLELTAAAVDREPHSGNGDVVPVCRPVEHFLDVGGKPAELDRALDQAPQAECDHQDERRGERRHPHQAAVRPAPHPLRGGGHSRQLARRVALLCSVQPCLGPDLTESL